MHEVRRCARNSIYSAITSVQNTMRSQVLSTPDRHEDLPYETDLNIDEIKATDGTIDEVSSVGEAVKLVFIVVIIYAQTLL